MESSSAVASGQEKDNKKKVAIITGVTGQDGSYLVEWLLYGEPSSQYEAIYGVVRRSSSIASNERLPEAIRTHRSFFVREADLTDSFSIHSLLRDVAIGHPEAPVIEIYNLAAQSHVKVSFEQPEYTTNVDALGPLRFVEAIRAGGDEFIRRFRFYQACTSELFGKVVETPQRETTPFYPRSPYGVAKLYSYWITKNYRESYGIFACNGILFNHESERRGVDFVTRKITRAVARLTRAGGENEPPLELGNIEARRDWGHASDYIRGMWMMLQQEEPRDYVLATGEVHSVREFIEIAFGLCGINIRWEGEGVEECGYDDQTGRLLIRMNPAYYRPSEVDLLVGDATLAREELGWSPRISFYELVERMVNYDKQALASTH